MEIGSNIRKIRKLLDLSQDAVIKNCSMKISQTTLSKIENGSIPIDCNSDRFFDIAGAMDVPPDVIINYNESLHLTMIIQTEKPEEREWQLNPMNNGFDLQDAIHSIMKLQQTQQVLSAK
jgi:transcriptional regulator with XRE-family HTH domain